MIQQQTILKVSDNSGAKTVKCIKVLGGFKRKFAKLGDTIIVSVQQLRNKFRMTSKVKKGEIYKAIIIRTKKINKNKDGSYIYLNENAVALIGKRGGPLATRIVGPLPSLLRKKKDIMKFFSISSGYIK
jgi:large subunit ribosomal protein L14